MQPIEIPEEIRNADAIYVSHSGGKDSQAMLALVDRLAGTEQIRGKIYVVHSDLGDMEHEPMHRWIMENNLGHKVFVVKPSLSFWDLCRKWKRLPDGRARFCTMYLKTEPIEAFIHQHMTEHGYRTAVNAVGIRAEESPSRAAKSPFGKSKMTKPRLHPGHRIFDWYPIFDYLLADVLAEISAVGQKPHRIYSEGYSRLSCAFCVFAKKHELQLSARKYPEQYQKIVALERELGRSIRLKQHKGVKLPHWITEYCGE